MQADNNRLQNALGLAMKAGKCVSGDFAVEKAVREGLARLVLLDETASQSTKERYHRLCTRVGVEIVTLTALGQAIGKPARMIAALTDDNMCRMMQGALASRDRNGR